MTQFLDEYKRHDLLSFIRESNEIEGIYTEARVTAMYGPYEVFIQLPTLTIQDVSNLVQHHTRYTGVRLRDQTGIDLLYPPNSPPGGPHVKERLIDFLSELSANPRPWEDYCFYEWLHPFTDGNGRSGRAIWLWGMYKLEGEIPLSFLKKFHYQTLQHQEKKYIRKGGSND